MLRAAGGRPGKAKPGRAGVLVVADHDLVEAGGERDGRGMGAVAVRGVVENDGGAVDPERGTVVGGEMEGVVARRLDPERAGEARGEVVLEARIQAGPRALRAREVDRGDGEPEIGGESREVGERCERGLGLVERGEPAGDERIGRRSGIRRFADRVGRNEGQRQDDQGRIVEGKQVGVRLDVVARREERPVRIVVLLGGEARGAAGGGVRDDGFVRGGVLERERGAFADGGEPGGGGGVGRFDDGRAEILRHHVRRGKPRRLGVAEKVADLGRRGKDGGIVRESGQGAEQYHAKREAVSFKAGWFHFGSFRSMVRQSFSRHGFEAAFMGGGCPPYLQRCENGQNRCRKYSRGVSTTKPRAADEA